MSHPGELLGLQTAPGGDHDAMYYGLKDVENIGYYVLEPNKGGPLFKL